MSPCANPRTTPAIVDGPSIHAVFSLDRAGSSPLHPPVAMLLLRPCAPALRSTRLARPVFAMSARMYASTTGGRVELAFDHHAPPKEGPHGPQDAPIIFMHGLFGSKKNNRSVSK